MGITSTIVRARTADTDKIKLPIALDEPLFIGAASAVWGLLEAKSFRVMPTSLDDVVIASVLA